MRENLPIALFGYKISPIARLKASPFELLYSRTPNILVNLGKREKSIDSEKNKEIILRDIKKVILKLQETAR